MLSVVAALRRHCEWRPPPYPGRRGAHVRAVIMDSRIGLDYIVENPEYTAKLAGGECCWDTGSWERWEDTGSWEC